MASKRRSVIDNQQSKYRTAFKDADRDRSGKIDFEELLAVLAALGKNTKPEEVRKFFDDVDKDKSGLIDEEEFVVMMENIENAWVGIQKKTFTRWANTVLIERMLKLKDLQTDLKDGLMLVPLLEILSGKSVGKPNPKPKLRLHNLENLNLSLTFLARERIKLVNIGADDIEQGNLKIILGLIWTLILNYQINASGNGNNPKAVLLEWVKKQCAPYGVGQELQSFRIGWSDGKVLSALTDSLGLNMNETIDNRRLNPDPLASTQHAIATAEQAFQIPPVVDAVDVVESPEEHSIMTYVSYFRDYMENKKKQDSEAEARAKRRADPNNCIAYGPGVDGSPFNNEKTDFIIESRNYLGQPLEKSDPNAQFAVQVEGPDNFRVNIGDDGKGKHPSSYLPRVPGTYQLTITCNGQPIKDGVRVVEVQGPDASRCTASGPGVTGDDARNPKTHFVIKSMRPDGKLVGHGGDPFEVVVIDPTGHALQAEITDGGNGDYRVTYPLNAPGPYEVQASLNGVPIKDSPFLANMTGGDASKSYAEGPGLVGGKVGVPLDIKIYAIAKDGKPFPRGGDPFRVAVDGPNGPVPVDLYDNKDGTYKATYVPQLAGPHRVAVLLGSDHVKNSPATANIKPAIDASRSWAEGPGLEKALDNRPAVFTVYARDDKDQPIRGELPEVSIVPAAGTHGNPLPAEVKDNGDGSYTVKYEPNVPGVYTVDARYGGESVNNCPKQVVVEKGVNQSKSWADGPGLEKGLDDRPAEFTVHANDDKGKPVIGRIPDVRVTPARGTNGPDLATDIRDNGDGTYSVLYEPTQPGVYVVDAQYDGVSIQNVPKEVKIERAVDLTKSWADGPGLEKAFDNRPAQFTVHAIDRDGQPVPGRVPEVTINPVDNRGKPIKPDVRDNGDGTYTVNFAPDEPGVFLVDARYEDGSVQELPREVEVLEGADENDLDGGTFRFTIKAKNKKGQVKTTGGDDFRVTVSGPAQPNGEPLDVHVTSSDNGDGSYSAEYSLEFARVSDKAQEFKVRVELNGKQVKGSPFKQYF